jgi:alpha-tubulin suppressor-like RCC1 family protein
MSNYISTTDGDLDRVYMTSNSLFNLYLANTSQQYYTLYMAGSVNSNETFGGGELPNTAAYALRTTSPLALFPILTDSKYGWKQISIGINTGAGVKHDGTLWAWGAAANGMSFAVGADPTSPIIVNNSSGNTWSSVVRGENWGLAITTQGRLWAWGFNSNGNLGDGTTSWRSSLVRIDSANTWSKVAISQTNSPEQSTLAIKSNGTLWAWGGNSYGQLGLDTFGSQSSIPTAVSNAIIPEHSANTWSAVAVSSKHTLAISADPGKSGWVYSWGDNLVGELGSLDGAGIQIGNKGRPTLMGTSQNFNYSPYISNATAVAAANYQSAAIAGGVLWTWGDNGVGQLGDGTEIAKSSPVTVAGGGTTWKKVSMSNLTAFTAALKTDGTMWYWGYNQFGQAGNGSSELRYSSPQLMTNWSGNTWYDISSGVYTFAAVREY